LGAKRNAVVELCRWTDLGYLLKGAYSLVPDVIDTVPGINELLPGTDEIVNEDHRICKAARQPAQGLVRAQNPVLREFKNLACHSTKYEPAVGWARYFSCYVCNYCAIAESAP